jgi:uncharacterized protein (PEP-CTERM system associated)
MNRSTNHRQYQTFLAPSSVAGVVAWLCLACLPAWAQNAAGSRAVSVVPTFAATVSFSEIQGAAGQVDGGEFVTRLSPGIQMRSRSGRLVGSLDYSLNANFYSRNKESQSIENALNATFTLEAVPSFFFVDTRASVSQQSLSAFGQQNADGSLRANDNRTDVLNLALSPYVRGPLGSAGEYEVRLNAAATNGYKSVTADSTNTGGTLSLRSRNTGSMFGWSLLASQQRVDFRAGRATDSGRASAAVTMVPEHDLKLTLRGGQETTDVGGFERRRYDNWGGGLRWTPTDRTVINVEGDRRYYGTGHQIAVEHRLRTAVFRYSSARDASSGADATGVGQPVTLYQLWFARFASIEPDPVLRDRIVRDLLRTAGQDPNAVVSGGAITSAVTLQRRDDLSMALVGKRTSLNLQAFASSTQIIDNPTGAADEGPVRQRGLIASLTHRVTPQSTLSLTASMQKTLANLRQQGTDLQSLALGWNSVINNQATAGLSVRHSVFDSAIDSYRESAITASLSLRF